MEAIMAVIEKVIENGVLTLTVQGFAPLVYDPASGLWPRETVDYASLHGMAQKLGDAGALPAGATPAEKHEAICALYEHLLGGGAWNRKGGDGTGSDGLLVSALVEWTNGADCPEGQPALTRDDARAAVKTMDKKTQAAMRAAEPLAGIIARLRTEKAPKAPVGFNAASILAGLTPPKA